MTSGPAGLGKDLLAAMRWRRRRVRAVLTPLAGTLYRDTLTKGEEGDGSEDARVVVKNVRLLLCCRGFLLSPVFDSSPDWPQLRHFRSQFWTCVSNSDTSAS